MEKLKVLLDSDVIINWITREIDSKTLHPLWKAPYQIIKKIERNEIKGLITTFTLLEIRFVLLRKKKFSRKVINELCDDLQELFDVVVPGEICLIKALDLQRRYFTDPFDSITLAYLISMEEGILITRDKRFSKISKKFITVNDPDEFVEGQKRK